MYFKRESGWCKLSIHGYELALEFKRISALKIKGNLSIMKKGGTACNTPLCIVLFFGGFMENIIMFIVLFIIVYLIYTLFVIHNKKALEKMKTGRELTYLKRLYHLDYDKLNMEYIARLLALMNAFILSLTTTIVTIINSWVNNFYLWLIICLLMSIVILIPLILIIYNIIGKHLKKKMIKE